MQATELIKMQDCAYFDCMVSKIQEIVNRNDELKTAINDYHAEKISQVELAKKLSIIGPKAEREWFKTFVDRFAWQPLQKNLQNLEKLLAETFTGKISSANLRFTCGRKTINVIIQEKKGVYHCTDLTSSTDPTQQISWQAPKKFISQSIISYYNIPDSTLVQLNPLPLTAPNRHGFLTPSYSLPPKKALSSLAPKSSRQ